MFKEAAMNRGQFVFAVVVFASCFAAAQSSTGNPTNNYTVANVKGSYSMLMNAWTTRTFDLGPTGDQGAQLAILHFDGTGSWSGSFRQSSTDTVVSQQLAGNYSVEPNGAGSLTISKANFAPDFLNFVLNSVSGSISGGLQLVDDLEDDLPQALAGTAVLIDRTGQPAVAANVKGTYSILFNRWSTSRNQQAILGTMTFDGVGKFTFSLTQQKGGFVTLTSTGSGTYIIDSSGIGFMSFAYSFLCPPGANSICTDSEDSGTLRAYFVPNQIVGGQAKGFQWLVANSQTHFVLSAVGVHQ
jgi:hypothetical protein